MYTTPPFKHLVTLQILESYIELQYNKAKRRPNFFYNTCVYVYYNTDYYNTTTIQPVSLCHFI